MPEKTAQGFQPSAGGLIWEGIRYFPSFHYVALNPLIFKISCSLPLFKAREKTEGPIGASILMNASPRVASSSESPPLGFNDRTAFGETSTDDEYFGGGDTTPFDHKDPHEGSHSGSQTHSRTPSSSSGKSSASASDMAFEAYMLRSNRKTRQHPLENWREWSWSQLLEPRFQTPSDEKHEEIQDLQDIHHNVSSLASPVLNTVVF
jgi:hypothetical protein